VREIAHAAVTRRPAISLHTMVPRTGGNTYAVEVWELSFVQGTILCRARAKLSELIRERLHRCTSSCVDPGGPQRRESVHGAVAALQLRRQSHVAAGSGPHGEVVVARRNSHAPGTPHPIPATVSWPCTMGTACTRRLAAGRPPLPNVLGHHFYTPFHCPWNPSKKLTQKSLTSIRCWPHPRCASPGPGAGAALPRCTSC
jgi:hypothetical protein